MTTSVFSHISRTFTWLIALLSLLVSCSDERLGGGISPETDNEGKVKVTFSLNIPGLIAPTRAEDGVDEQIETIDLFLFDEDDLLTEVVHLTKTAGNESFTENNGQYESNSDTDKNSEGEYVTPESGTTGTYTAWIDGNTSRIHFIANLKEGEFDFKEHEGGSETEVIAPLITQNRLYWGRATFDGSVLSQNPVVLHRNYAKVKVGTVANGLVINGWSLYHRPQYGTWAPCDRNKLSGSSTDDQESLNPFDFTLGTSDVSLPLADKCIMTENNSSKQQEAQAEIDASSSNVAYWLFEYQQDDFDNAEPVYAIFNITQAINGTETSLYYKIALLYDAEKDSYGNVTSRLPYTIKRNHEYTINFNGLSHEAGWTTFDEAVNHDPANNTEITIEERVPEIVSANHTLRIEETEEGSTTVRYYKDYTDPNVTYTISDILVYYDGDDCTTNGTTALMGNSLQVSWQGDAPTEYVDNSLSIEQAVDADGEAIAHTYRVSFQMKGFADSESLSLHYTQGTLCIAEQHEKLLKRYVKVYMGPAITFSPLLISSDIPNLTDERLTILFTIPDESYLPDDLFPLEISFGSDRIDVERNLYVDAMKVDFGADAAENYTHVLRWQGTSSSSTDWKWAANAANTVTNTWGYKYIYTIATPPTSNEAQQRITLRTVITDEEDFKVLMEGRSTVTGTNVFNTRELDFMMQNDGTATFDVTSGSTTYGSWIPGTTGSTDQYQRIMLDDGLPESRYATRYINVVGFISGTTVTIPYTLGTLVDGMITADDETAKTAPVLWVHYDNTKFEPTSVSSGTLGSEQTDANGNTFVSVAPNSTGWAKGSITFNVLNEAKNSMIFFTARNMAKYGVYDSNTFADGNAGYVYTGVNELASTYRSAGAMVSTVNKWDFNPAPSTTDGNYSFADKISIPSGKDEDLYVRIDRPSGETTTITIDTQGALTLQDAPRSITVTGSDGTSTTTPDYTYTGSNGVYTVTLNSMESDYAYLHFKVTNFSSSCTIKFSGTLYNDGELIIANAATRFLAFEYAQEEELVNDVPTYATATNVIPAIKGALIGVRVYLPKALYTALNSGKDADNTSENIFSFCFTSRNFKPVTSSSPLTTVFNKQSRYDYYTVAPSIRNNTTHIITVKEGALTDAGKSITTVEGETIEACYIDLLLESTTIESAENVKFLGDNETATGLSFYPFNTSIACSGSYQATVEHSADGSNWIATPLSEIADASAVYYRVTMPNLGLARKDLPVTFSHNGKLAIPSGSALTDIDDDDENTFVFNMSTTANAETQTVFQLEKEGNIADGTQEPVVVTPADGRIYMDSTTLMMAAQLAITPTSVAIYSKKTDATTTIYENGAALGIPYLDLPTESGQTVNLMVYLDEAYNGQELTLTLTSTDKNRVGLEAKNNADEDYTNTVMTSTVSDGSVKFELKTRYAGTAEIFTINIQNSLYILPEIKQLMATSVSGYGTYNVTWTSEGDVRGKKQGDGNEIFDNQQSQNALGLPTGLTSLAAPYEDLTTGIKFDGKGYISFYAPIDKMVLSAVIGTHSAGDNGTLGIYKADGTLLNDGNDGTGTIDLDGTVITQELEEAGLYYLKRKTMPSFSVYALTLTLPSAPFGDFKWYATKADGAAVGRGSGTWGTADALITATDADSDGTLDVWVSDFAQELYMNVAGLNDGETTLTITGDYKFKDGTTTQTVTPTDGAATLTLVPVTCFDSNNELVNGSFTLSGVSSNFSYTETVDVNIRPWVLLTTNIEEYAGYAGSNKWSGILIPYTNEYKQVYKLTDAQHNGATISLRPDLEFNTAPYLTIVETPVDGWGNKEIVTFNSVATGTEYTFKWRADNPGTAVPKYLSYGNTDIVVEDETNGNIPTHNVNLDYPYDGLTYKVNRLTCLAPFMNAGATQGYLQYSTDNTDWSHVLGDGGEADYLHAEYSHYYATTGTVPTFNLGSTFYLRISIPAAITADDAAYLKVKDDNGNDRSSAFGTPVIDTKGGWATFTVTASSTAETWSNLYVYDSRIDDSNSTNRGYTELGQSARFHLKFEETAAELAAELTIELLQSDGTTAINNNDYSTYVGEHLYLRLTARTAGTIPFKLNLQKGNSANSQSTVSSGQTTYLRQICTTKNGVAVDDLFTLEDMNTEVTISNAEVGDTYIVCYEVLQPYWYRFKAEVCQSTLYTLKGSPDQQNGVTFSAGFNALPTDVYDYYCLDSSTKTNTLYKNGVALTSFTDNVLTLTASQQIQNNDKLTVTTTPVGCTEEQTLVSTKVGSSQGVTITVPYKMNVTIIWSPRSDKSGTGMKITYPDNTTETTTETVEQKMTKSFTCPKGTLKIERGGNEFWLYYIKLEPAI